MKKIICIFVLLGLISTILCGCGNENKIDESSSSNLEPKNESSLAMESETQTFESTEGNEDKGELKAVTQEDVVDTVNEFGDVYGYPVISDYNESDTENGKNFTFTYAHLDQYPTDSCGVIGATDEKGIKYLHTTFVFNNTGFDGAAALALSYIPAIALYCPEEECGEAINIINSAFQNGVSEDTSKSFVNGEYEFTLNIKEQFLLVSVIRQDING